MDNKKQIKAIIWGTLFGATICAILLALLSIALNQIGLLPTQYISVMIIVTLALCGICGGYLGARIYRAKGLLLGMIIGIILFLIITISGLIGSKTTISIFTLYKAIALIVGGAIGGVIGVNKMDKIKIK